MRENRAVVCFENVCLTYPEAPVIFSEVSFRLTPGSFTFLTGASGAGKTSLMKMIYLGLHQTNGQIYLFGHDTSGMRSGDYPSVRRRMGVVLQDLGLIDHLSVFENVALPLKIRGLNVTDYTRDIIELLDWVGLRDRIDANPAVLSGGEKQRVCIARAVITRPDLILADEPTGSVDPEMADRLLRLFAELNKLGATVLIATHDHDLINRYRGDVLKLSGGRLWGMPYRSFRESGESGAEFPAEFPDEAAFHEKEKAAFIAKPETANETRDRLQPSALHQHL